MNELMRLEAEQAAKSCGWQVPGDRRADGSLEFVDSFHSTRMTIAGQGAAFVVSFSVPAVTQDVARAFKAQGGAFHVDPDHLEDFVRSASQSCHALTAKSAGSQGSSGPISGTRQSGPAQDTPSGILAALPPDLQRLASQDPTVREALVKQRVGQDKYRAAMEVIWSHRCPLTGIDHRDLLVASHAKPWADCDPAERLDPYNGILLAVHLDRLFDKGWMTFDAVGAIVLSSQISSALASQLLQGAAGTCLTLHPRHQPYLAWHREQVFKA
jgi:hypothetical protein